MDGVYSHGKSKRKELDQINDDFSDFSLSSPARKIRRLDAELPPILEEEEPMIQAGFEQLEHERSGSNIQRGVLIEELPVIPENEERALVVFKPKTPPMRSLNNFTVSVYPRLVSEFKNQAIWPYQRNRWRAVDDSKEQVKDSRVTNEYLAVVPWVPPQLPSIAENPVPAQLESTDMMEAENMDAAVTMDVEEEGGDSDEQTREMNLNDAVPHWQQQHCLFPQPPPHNTTTPVVWFK